MPTMTVEEAQARLSELVGGLGNGGEIKLTRGGRVVARLVSEPCGSMQRPGPGLGKGMLTVLAEDEEHLTGFSEYMP
jgi:antitoxin (DNA-binding transcriptional repressor) of toxin-antitoxin stability system